MCTKHERYLEECDALDELIEMEDQEKQKAAEDDFYQEQVETV